MSFNTALSGLNAAQADLNVTANNIANVSTTGFKESRAEFADIFATSSFGASGTAIGNGVLLANVAQQFNQGNLEFTANTLDLAISGEGFFVLSPSETNTNAVPEAPKELVANMSANSALDSLNPVVLTLAILFATSSFGASGTAIGNGVLLANVAQQFNQGNLEFTANTLDLAISGEGFFVLSPSETNTNAIFSRNGEFGVDSNGFVVNNAGARLQVFPVNADGTVTATSLSSTIPLQLPQTQGVPTVTSAVDVGVNLPANAAILDPLSFDPQQASSFNASTSLTVFDSLGESHVVTAYYVKTADNQWATYYNTTDDTGATLPIDITGGIAGAGGQLYHQIDFDSSGGFVSNTPDPAITTAIDFGNGSDPTQSLNFGYAGNGTTQFSSPFTVNVLNQNGFPIGRLTGVEISNNGVIRANFSNGQNIAIGKVALARFQNAQGLSQIGNNSWEDNVESGTPLVGEALTSSFGQVRSGALEVSNVDLTAQLVNLISAQRNFQANAKTIETNNTITQAIINIR